MAVIQGRAETERDGTRAETRFGFPAKRTSPFISAGVSVQSAAGSRGCASAVVMLDRLCPIQCTTAGYPLHSPFSHSLLHPCVSVCHHIPFLLYLHLITAAEFWRINKVFLF